MTLSERERQIMNERAERLAQRPDETRGRHDGEVMMIARLGDQKLGLPQLSVSRIVQRPPLARLYATPPAVVGLAQVRGTVLSVIDVRGWFDLEQRGLPALLAILEGPEGWLGLLMDEVIGFRAIQTAELSPSPHAEEGRPVLGMTRDLVTLIDIQGLFGSDQIRNDDPKSP